VRDSYGDGEQAAHDIMRAAAERIGLEISVDAIGNLTMTLPGKDRGAPRILIGSHLDSVPQGGNFDGAAGVVAGICALSALRQAGFVPDYDIGVMAIRAEESSWFDVSYLGSAGAFGLLDPACLSVRRSDNGRTLEETLDRASAQMAFTMVLLAIAAGVTLVLGAIGTYGVMSYIVSQRTGEIGVRLALGAEPGNVAGMIARQGGLVALVGAAVGLGVALAGSRLIESLLYNVSPRDPGVFAATTALLVAVALAACWLPARRASRLSPMEALRTE